MQLHQISFESILDEASTLRLVREELSSRILETSSLDIPVVGEVQLEINAVELNQLKFLEGYILNNLSIDLTVTPAWPNLQISVVGRLQVEIRIEIDLSKTDFIRTNVILTEFDWRQGPTLHIWKRRLKLWLIKKVSEWQISKIGESVDKLVSSLLVPDNLSKQIAGQLRPIRISDQLFAQFGKIKLDLQSLRIANGLLKVSGEIDASIDFLDDLQRLGRCEVILQHRPVSQDDDLVDVKVTVEEINQVINAFLDDLNQEVLKSKNLISSISLAIREGALKVTMVPSKMKHSALIMTIAMEFEEEQQQLRLCNLKVRASEDAGFVLKALTYTLRGTVEKLVKKKFPLDVTPLLQRIAAEIESEGPESLDIKVDPISIKSLEYAADHLVGTFQMRVKMSTIEGKTTLA